MLPRWSKEDRASLLLEAAAGLATAEEQREYLEAACADEPALADELTETLTMVEREPAEEVETALPAPGDVLGERFHITQRLGEGGMAAVFEAVDAKLMERRALKFPRARYSRRFPEEVRAAVRITHENICRIHEIHSTPDSDFLSMELVDGETLAARLRRGPLDGAEILDVARQLCRGLDAAHKAGILHQDLKPGNVMLAKRAGGGIRVVVTDFGLAAPLGATGTAAVAGTPNYIAPERWKGGRATAASDVYAIGVILYEMTAGRLPFGAGSRWKERLNRLPEPPSGRPHDRRWDRIAMRCLEPNPARRYGSAGEVLAAIERAFAPLYRRRSAMAAAALLLVATPVVAFRERIWPPPVARLAILPLAGSTGDASMDAAARGAVYDVARQLESLGAKSQRVLVIPAQDAVRYEVAKAETAASKLGATHVLAARVEPRTGGFRMRAGVTDAASGMTLREMEGDFASRDTPALAASLAGVVTSAFRMRQAPKSEVSPAAYPAYAAGVDAFESVPPKNAIALAHFQAAAQIDGSSAVIAARIADTEVRLYRAEHRKDALEAARRSAERAQSLQPDLPAALQAMGWVEQEEGRTERAIELFRRAAELEPKNAEAWRRTGLALQRVGRQKEALEALKHSAQLAPGYLNARLSLGSAYYGAGQIAEAVEEFRISTHIAPAYPNGYTNLGGALAALGRDAEAEAAFRKALDIRETSATLNNLGVLLRYRRRDAEAAAAFERALRAGPEDAALRLNLAMSLHAAGDPAAAARHFERAAALARAGLLIDPSNAAARARLSYAMARLNQGGAARDEALQAAHAAPADPVVLLWSVLTLDTLGRRDEALALLSGASRERLQDLRRQPDLADFVRDARFVALVDRSQPSNERKN